MMFWQYWCYLHADIDTALPRSRRKEYLSAVRTRIQISALNSDIHLLRLAMRESAACRTDEKPRLCHGTLPEDLPTSYVCKFNSLYAISRLIGYAHVDSVS